MASTVTIDFNAQLTRFTSAIDKATSDLNKFQSNAARISSNVSRTLGTLGVGISGAGLVSFVNSAIDAADKLEDLNKTTGIAVEQLAGLDLAARQSGGDLESVAASINKLSTNIGQNAEKFRELGITATDPLEAFKQLSDIFVSIEDPQKRAAFAAEALGKSWQGAAPLLAEGGENIQKMVDRGIDLSGVTEKNVKQSAAFKDQLAELNTLSNKIGLTVGELVVPALSDYLEIVAKSATGTDYFTGVLERFKLAATNLAPGIAAIVRLFSDDEASPQSAAGKIKRTAEATDKKVDEFINATKDASNKKVSAARASVDRNAEEAKRFIESLTKEVETLGLSGTALREYEAAHLKLTPAQKAVVADALKKIQAFEDEQARLEKLNEAYENHQRVIDDFNTRELEAQEEQSANDAEREESLKRDAQLIRETLDPTIKLYNEIAKVQALQSEGLIDQEEADAAIKKLEDDFANAKKKAEETTNVAKELGITFSSAFEDAIVGGKGFREILSGIEQDIIRIITRKLVTEPAANAIGDLLGDFNFGSFFGGLFNAKGNAFNSSGVMAFANGGVVNSATPFSFGGGRLGVMGEAGPEAILPLKRGANGQLGVQMTGGAPIIMNITTPDANSFRKSQPQIMADMQRSLNRGRRVV
jgi:hypothetical protein